MLLLTLFSFSFAATSSAAIPGSKQLCPASATICFRTKSKFTDVNIRQKVTTVMSPETIILLGRKK